LIAITFNGHEADSENLIGKVIELKFRGQLDLINITGEIDDEFYILNLDYENNYVETIQIKCELCENYIKLDKILNAPRTYYLQKFCTINLIGGKNKKYETTHIQEVSESNEGVNKKTNSFHKRNNTKNNDTKNRWL